MIPASVVLVVTLIALAAVMLRTPRLSRRGLFFGFTVPGSFAQSPAGQRIFRTYAAILLAATVPGLYLAVAKSRGEGIPLLLGAYLLAYGWARRATQAYQIEPSRIREASLTTRRDPLPGGWLAWLLPFALPATSLFLTARYWGRIPARVSIHYDAAGQADRWVAKSWWSVNALPLMAISITLALLLLAWQVTRARRISAAGAAAESESGRRRFLLLAQLGILYLLNLLFTAITLEMLGLVSTWAARSLVLALLVWVVATLIFVGRYAHHRQQFEPEADRTSDEHWHFGLFYANPADPSILVEQRVGFGYSLNFARPGSWAILALTIGPGIGMSFLR
ncbi:MAG: DUF1648 domain-containing protein [Bryobacteraceae bacterium]|nr:DUF1648 domain-containing protein [Bryobacteraceae bacterium]